MSHWPMLTAGWTGVDAARAGFGTQLPTFGPSHWKSTGWPIRRTKCIEHTWRGLFELAWVAWVNLAESGVCRSCRSSRSAGGSMPKIFASNPMLLHKSSSAVREFWTNMRLTRNCLAHCHILTYCSHTVTHSHTVRTHCHTLTYCTF